FYRDPEETEKEEVAAPVVEVAKPAPVKDDYIQDWSTEMAPTPAAVPDWASESIPVAAVPIQGSTPSWSIADAGDWSASAPPAAAAVAAAPAPAPAPAPAGGVVGDTSAMAAPANDWGGGAATEDWSK
ncbi:hypothetical protein GH868_29745, partial [Bacillus thuringiensis]|nr:hypothetical protein [Bacillus thuringiensis]